MRTSDKGIALIKKYEGCVLKAYRCPANVWTIGYGHTGPDVKPGMKITQAEANAMLKRDLPKYERPVLAALGVAADRLLQEEFDAMVSLCYNIGAANFKKSSVARLFIAGNRNGSANAFGMWNKAKVNGAMQVLPGLTKRRAEEKALFLSASDSRHARFSPDEDTDEVEVPEGSVVPSRASDKPLTRSKEAWTGGALGLTGVFNFLDGFDSDSAEVIKGTVSDVQYDAQGSFAERLHIPEIAGGLVFALGMFILFKRITDRKKGIR